MAPPHQKRGAGKVWQAAVFVGLVVGIPIVVAALLGGKPKTRPAHARRESKAT